MSLDTRLHVHIFVKRFYVLCCIKVGEQITSTQYLPASSCGIDRMVSEPVEPAPSHFPGVSCLLRHLLGHQPWRPGLASMMSVANLTMQHVPAAPYVHKFRPALFMAKSSRPRALRATFRTCCSAQTDSTKGHRKHVRSNGLNFVVDDHGDTGATPVILLHGFPNNANVWEKQVCIILPSAL